MKIHKALSGLLAAFILIIVLIGCSISTNPNEDCSVSAVSNTFNEIRGEFHEGMLAPPIVNSRVYSDVAGFSIEVHPLMLISTIAHPMECGSTSLVEGFCNLTHEAVGIIGRVAQGDLEAHVTAVMDEVVDQVQWVSDQEEVTIDGVRAILVLMTAWEGDGFGYRRFENFFFEQNGVFFQVVFSALYNVDRDVDMTRISIG